MCSIVSGKTIGCPKLSPLGTNALTVITYGSLSLVGLCIKHSLV